MVSVIFFEGFASCSGFGDSTWARSLRGCTNPPSSAVIRASASPGVSGSFQTVRIGALAPGASSKLRGWEGARKSPPSPSARLTKATPAPALRRSISISGTFRKGIPPMSWKGPSSNSSTAGGGGRFTRTLRTAAPSETVRFPHSSTAGGGGRFTRTSRTAAPSETVRATRLSV